MRIRASGTLPYGSAELTMFSWKRSSARYLKSRFN